MPKQFLPKCSRLRTIALALTIVANMNGMGQSFAAEATSEPSVAPGSRPDKVQYNRDIRPIMSDTCFHCHGPDKNARKAGLRLDQRDVALKPAESGETPLVPGQPDKSEIIKRIFSDDKDAVMPPRELHKDLTAKQKELLKRWVAEGAEYEAHWAYTPLVRPTVPKVEQPVSTFTSSQAVDAFILDKLAEKKIAPSPEADRRTLLRRLSLDLTGLPPTPEEMQAFLDDKSENAYEKQVDRLLASPRFGERMAVWWLDVARFADTVGFHGDQNQRVFPFRDYVIDAFNSNKSFQQFTLEQIAGDLLPNPTPEQITATCFNRLNMMTREGGGQPKEYLAKYGAERVRTIGGAWLGSTLTCCECHDHKYDPFTMRDFYSLQSFFADVKQWGIYADYAYTPNPDLKNYNNDHPFPPELEVENSFLKRRIEKLRGKMTDLAKNAAAERLADGKVRGEFNDWLAATHSYVRENPTGWNVPPIQVALEGVAVPAKKGAKRPAPPADAKPTDLKPADAPAEKLPYSVEADGRVLLPNKPNQKATFTLEAKPGWVSAIRLELLPDAKFNNTFLTSGKKEGTQFKLSIGQVVAASGKEHPVGLRICEANLHDREFRDGSDVLGLGNGWKTVASAADQVHVAVCLFMKPVRLAAGDTLAIHCECGNVGSLRLSVTPFLPHNLRNGGNLADVSGEFAQLDIAKIAALKSAEEIPGGVRAAWMLGTNANDDAVQKCMKLYAEILECRGGRAWTMVTESIPNPLTIRVLPRGNWMDESGPIVQPATPAAVAAKKPGTSGTTAASASNEKTSSEKNADQNRRLSRLDLGRWLCSAENPLTPRAVVNRWWKQLFGNGLSMIVDDLGAQGETPSHPELLDWLACDFRDNGWDVKRTWKLLAMSKTYRQSSNLRPELRDLDPNNRLLASQNPRRLEAEFVRDNALSVAGLLNLEMGGPSVKPYQPPGYYANLQFPNRDYVADTDERQWRRGVYTHWQRTFLHPMLANFDAPMRDECTAIRTVSNTPQQALTLLNDPTFVEAARAFATRLLREPAQDDNARVGRAFELALGRPAKDRERTSLVKLLKTERDYFAANVKDAEKLTHVGVSSQDAVAPTPEIAAWATVCRVILNLHESITRY